MCNWRKTMKRSVQTTKIIRKSDLPKTKSEMFS
ncbi:MAG TPA: hypothetical protein H9667_09470 [Firmicutes bacterium]|nr:hypothetical protein [Bacillota bacterium]